MKKFFCLILCFFVILCSSSSCKFTHKLLEGIIFDKISTDINDIDELEHIFSLSPLYVFPEKISKEKIVGFIARYGYDEILQYYLKIQYSDIEFQEEINRLHNLVDFISPNEVHYNFFDKNARLFNYPTYIWEYNYLCYQYVSIEKEMNCLIYIYTYKVKMENSVIDIKYLPINYELNLDIETYDNLVYEPFNSNLTEIAYWENFWKENE